MQNGVYFVTICVKDRHPLFGTVYNNEMRLSEHGEQVQRCIEMIEDVYPSVLLEAFIVMPNHVHLLLVLYDFNTNPSPQRLAKQLKSAVTKQIGFSPWQDGSYIRTILSAQKHKIAKAYIKENPRHWKEDRFAVTDGEFAP